MDLRNPLLADDRHFEEDANLEVKVETVEAEEKIEKEYVIDIDTRDGIVQLSVEQEQTYAEIIAEIVKAYEDRTTDLEGILDNLGPLLQQARYNKALVSSAISMALFGVAIVPAVIALIMYIVEVFQKETVLEPSYHKLETTLAYASLGFVLASGLNLIVPRLFNNSCLRIRPLNTAEKHAIESYLQKDLLSDSVPEAFDQVIYEIKLAKEVKQKQMTDAFSYGRKTGLMFFEAMKESNNLQIRDVREIVYGYLDSPKPAAQLIEDLSEKNLRVPGLC